MRGSKMNVELVMPFITNTGQVIQPQGLEKRQSGYVKGADGHKITMTINDGGALEEWMEDIPHTRRILESFYCARTEQGGLYPFDRYFVEESIRQKSPYFKYTD